MATGKLPAGTDYAGFWAHANQVFLPPNAERSAMNMLDRLKQGKLYAEDFFIKFELLAQQAGYLNTKFDKTKMKIAEGNLHPKLVDKLYEAYERPKDWEDFKTKVSMLDNLYQYRARDKQETRNALSNFARQPSYN